MAKILVVEDDFTIADNLKALLNVKGHQVVFAADGQAGVELARKEMPDILLLDILLPKLGGFDVCRILKSDPKTAPIKIIMLTGLGRMGDVETAFSAGANDYLIKPYDNERLVKKIDKVLASNDAKK